MNNSLKETAALLKLGMAVKRADLGDAILGAAIGSSMTRNVQPQERASYSDAEIAANINDPEKRERVMQSMADAARLHDGRMGRAGHMVTGGILGGIAGGTLGGSIGRSLVNEDDSTGKKVVKTIVPWAIGHGLGIAGGVLGGNHIYKKNRNARREKYVAGLRAKINALRAARGMEQ